MLVNRPVEYSIDLNNNLIGLCELKIVEAKALLSEEISTDSRVSNFVFGLGATILKYSIILDVGAILVGYGTKLPLEVLGQILGCFLQLVKVTGP